VLPALFCLPAWVLWDDSLIQALLCRAFFMGQTLGAFIGLYLRRTLVPGEYYAAKNNI
jgi:hypothetical protein